MKDIRFWGVALLLLIGFQSNTYAQVDQTCKNLFRTAQNMASKGNYEGAKTKFKGAQTCDKGLTNAAQLNIKKCEQKIAEQNAARRSAQKRSHKSAYASQKGVGGTQLVEATVNKEQALAVFPSSVNFNAAGGNNQIAVESNREWKATCDAKWLTVEQTDSTVELMAGANDKQLTRSALVQINDGKTSKVIAISQAGTEPFLKASDGELTYDYAGGAQIVEVISNSDAWNIDQSTLKPWFRIDRSGTTVTVYVDANKSPYSRAGAITLQNGDDKQYILVSQDGDVSLTNYDRKPFAFGIVGGPTFASFITSGDNLASAVDYGWGYDNPFNGGTLYSLSNSYLYDGKNVKTREPSYKTQTGFTIGLMGELRIKKHLFFQTGVYYTNLRVKNTVQNLYYVNCHYMANIYPDYQNGYESDNYTEKYTLNYTEIPLLLNLHIPTSYLSQINLTFGGFIGMAASGKMKLSGTQNVGYAKLYNNVTGNSTSGIWYNDMPVEGELKLFDRDGSYYKLDDAKITTANRILASPFSKMNYGLKLGVGYEMKGLTINASYSLGLSNIANKDYWEKNRLYVSNQNDWDMRGSTIYDYGTNNVHYNNEIYSKESDNKIKNYSHNLGYFSITIGYTFRNL